MDVSEEGLKLSTTVFYTCIYKYAINLYMNSVIAIILFYSFCRQTSKVPGETDFTVVWHTRKYNAQCP